MNSTCLAYARLWVQSLVAHTKICACIMEDKLMQLLGRTWTWWKSGRRKIHFIFLQYLFPTLHTYIISTTISTKVCIYRLGNWGSWRLKGLPKPILLLSKSQNLSPGLPSSKVLSDTPGKAVVKVEEWDRQSALQRNPKMQGGLGFPSNPHTPKN